MENKTFTFDERIDAVVFKLVEEDGQEYDIRIKRSQKDGSLTITKAGGSETLTITPNAFNRITVK